MAVGLSHLYCDGRAHVRPDSSSHRVLLLEDRENAEEGRVGTLEKRQSSATNFSLRANFVHPKRRRMQKQLFYALLAQVRELNRKGGDIGGAFRRFSRASSRTFL